MLSILAKLCKINSHNFGVHCFGALKDVMVSGSDLQDKVKANINKEIISKLNEEDPESITISLLVGLRVLVEKSGETSLLSKLYESCFEKWLS